MFVFVWLFLFGLFGLVIWLVLFIWLFGMSVCVAGCLVGWIFCLFGLVGLFCWLHGLVGFVGWLICLVGLFRHVVIFVA